MNDSQADPSQSHLDSILLEAIDWMVLLESGLATTQDQQDFEAWLEQNIKHQQAWQQLHQDVDEPFQQLQQQSLDARLPMQAVTQSVLQANKQRNKRIVSSGISFILVACLGTLLWLQHTRPLSFIQADYYTRTAEQKQIRLEDGSRITLAAYSAIKVDFSHNKRDVYLLEGALVANVRADKVRPFIVHTQQAQMQALGTEFMVKQHAAFSYLAVLEHTVRASNSHQSKVTQQGQAVRVDQYQIQDLPVNAANLASWKDGIIQVEDMPLSEFIALVKPYHQGTIYLSKDVQDIKVYGVFYLNDTDKILQILQTTQPLKVYQKLGWVYVSKSD